VVTRPEPDHVRLMQLLGKKRLAALHNPGFRLQSEAEDKLKQLPARLAAFDLVIVTSPMAARLVAAHTEAGEVECVRFIAPGPSTGSFLEAAGIRVRWPKGGGTSEHILAMTAGDTAPKRVGIVGAPGGRNLLAEEFFSRGAEVVPIYVYHRVPVAPNPELVEGLGKGTELAILVSSWQAFETILARSEERRVGKECRSRWSQGVCASQAAHRMRPCWPPRSKSAKAETVFCKNFRTMPQTLMSRRRRHDIYPTDG